MQCWTRIALDWSESCNTYKYWFWLTEIINRRLSLDNKNTNQSWGSTSTLEAELEVPVFFAMTLLSGHLQLKLNSNLYVNQSLIKNFNTVKLKLSTVVNQDNPRVARTLQLWWGTNLDVCNSQLKTVFWKPEYKLISGINKHFKSRAWSVMGISGE